MDDDRPMGTREAAKFLGVSTATLYKRTCQHEIAFSKTGISGGKLLFRMSDLEDFLKRGRHPANSELHARAANR